MIRTATDLSPWRRAGMALLRATLALAGLLLMLGAMLLGMLLASGLLLWALLRGRRPGPMNLRWRSATVQRRPRRDSSGEVVDVQARVVDSSQQR